MTKDEIREMNARLAEFERAKKEFAETHEVNHGLQKKAESRA